MTSQIKEAIRAHEELIPYIFKNHTYYPPELAKVLKLPLTTIYDLIEKDILIATVHENERPKWWIQGYDVIDFLKNYYRLNRHYYKVSDIDKEDDTMANIDINDPNSDAYKFTHMNKDELDDYMDAQDEGTYVKPKRKYPWQDTDEIKHYTASEAAKILKLSRSTMGNWLLAGKVHSEKINGEYLVSSEDILNCMNDKTLWSIHNSICNSYTNKRNDPDNKVPKCFKKESTQEPDLTKLGHKPVSDISSFSSLNIKNMDTSSIKEFIFNLKNLADHLTEALTIIERIGL